MCHIFATYNTIGKQNSCKKFLSFWVERKFNNENFTNYGIYQLQLGYESNQAFLCNISYTLLSTFRAGIGTLTCMNNSTSDS